MIKTMISIFTENQTWRLWAAVARILIILLCVAVIVTITSRKRNNTFCKTCKRRVKKAHKYCDYCGTEMNSSNKEVIIGITKKNKVISVLAICVLSILLVFSGFQVVSNFTLSSYGTGMYTDYKQTYIEVEDTWGIECKKAITNGSFHQTITLNNDSNKTLYIDSESSFGTLILNVTQGDKIEQIDISNTKGVVEVNLSDFDANIKIDLRVEHTKVENMQFKIYW